MHSIQEKLQKQLNPILVKVSIEYSNNVYYIVMDGRDTYSELTEWIDNWPGGLVGFGKSFLSLQGIYPQEAINDNGIVKFVVGSLFDMLKNE